MIRSCRIGLSSLLIVAGVLPAAAQTDRWEKDVAGLKDVPVVVHHKSFTYLLDWLGLKQVGSLEPKPGIPPTTAHLESLLQTVKAHPVQMILRTPYEPDDASDG